MGKLVWKEVEFVKNNDGWKLVLDGKVIARGSWNTVDDPRSTLYALGIPYKVIDNMDE